ncbi:MAG: hypothetical protein C0432_06245 [Candidatus Puniceispirillum sp.]|nr:hypothetical protein [Candidatus Puniceispirillum sp.]
MENKMRGLFEASQKSESLKRSCQRLSANYVQMVEIIIQDAGISESGLSELIAALKVNKVIKKLKISEKKRIFSKSECMALIQALNDCTSLEEFSLENNLAIEAIYILADGLRSNRTILSFTFTRDLIEGEHIYPWITTLEHNHIITECRILCSSGSYRRGDDSAQRALESRINRNRREALQTFSDIMTRGQALMHANQWQEAAIEFERVTKNTFVTRYQSYEYPKEKAIYDAVIAYRKLCLERPKNSESSNTPPLSPPSVHGERAPGVAGGTYPTNQGLFPSASNTGTMSGQVPVNASVALNIDSPVTTDVQGHHNVVCCVVS